MKKKLTITIATIPKRKPLFDSLMNELKRQISTFGYEDEVEILFDSDDDRFLGTKRKLMLEKAQGLFTCAIDDDDQISEFYLYHLISAINQDETVDCLAINGFITTNGQDERKWFISCHYEDWFEKDKIYYRTPNHICPIRTDIARLVDFQDVDWGEDYPFSQNIKPFLKRETPVPEPIYWYRYNTEESLANYQKQKNESHGHN